MKHRPVRRIITEVQYCTMVITHSSATASPSRLSEAGRGPVPGEARAQGFDTYTIPDRVRRSCTMTVEACFYIAESAKLNQNHSSPATPGRRLSTNVSASARACGTSQPQIERDMPLPPPLLSGPEAPTPSAPQSAPPPPRPAGLLAGTCRRRVRPHWALVPLPLRARSALDTLLIAFEALTQPLVHCTRRCPRSACVRSSTEPSSATPALLASSGTPGALGGASGGSPGSSTASPPTASMSHAALSPKQPWP